MIPVVILAGGLGTRISAISKTKPKSLIEVGGQPFMYWQLDYLRQNNITDIVLCLSKGADQIIEFIEKDPFPEFKISISLDGDSLLGTGGCIKKALPLLPNDFFVMYGDSYLKSDLSKIQDTFQSSGKCGLMTVIKGSSSHEACNVKFEKGNILEYSKFSTSPDLTYIDYGLSILKKQVFRTTEKVKSFDLSIIFSQLASEGNLVAYEEISPYFEIGSPTGLDLFKDYLTGGNHGRRDI